jgi:NAD/NADP transhydrogenase alpha subunit
MFKQYYKNLGKQGYKFILEEEIGKIGKMSKEEFNDFVVVLGEANEEIDNAAVTEVSAPF